MPRKGFFYRSPYITAVRGLQRMAVSYCRTETHKTARLPPMIHWKKLDIREDSFLSNDTEIL